MKFLFPWKWKSNDRTAGTASSSRAATRLGMETMEPRCLLTVNPINIGAVYIEQDIGTDDTGDSFLVTFDGGVPETELRRLTIDGDQQISGFGVGDVFFDVDTQGLGADQSFDFQVTNQAGIDQVVATVADGGTRLVIDLVGFDAGEVLEFSIDVDEVEDFDPDEPNLEILNEGFDPITSGVEFQGSLLTAEFHAPDFYDITGTAEFRNRYDDALADSGLALPADNANGQRDRTAGAFIAVTQAPIPVSISGYVYHDRDLDGQRDAGEEGLAGVQVQVIPVETATAQAVVTVFTNAEGFYEAPELSPGTYRVVEVTQPAPFLDGLDTVGTVAGTRSGRLAAEGDAFVDVVMRGGQEGVEYNFGEVLPMTVRGRVQLSTRDGDCFGADEQHEPVAGAVVELLDAAGNVLETTRTDADGRYAFADLRPGTYGVRELTPEGLIDGGARSGSLEGRRVGEVAAAGLVTNLVALSGQVIDNVDFCEHLPAEIGGTVYHDRDDNGQRARDEEGISGVMVTLLDNAGQEVARQRTDAEGRYHFDGLRAGTYSVVESQPAGWLDGKDQVGTIRGTRVGVAANDRVDQVQLRWGDQGHDYDFGELRAVGIRGRVQLSTADGDCFTAYENHEPVGGARVELLDGTGQVLETTLTDANGEYAFEGLRPGTYAVREITPDGLIQGGARPGQVGATAVGAVNAQGVVTHLVTFSGQLVERVDFCEHLPASLSGNVYHDRNDDGQRQVGEEGISNVLVRLLDAAGQEVARQRTNAEGGYQFEGLRAGTYTVLEEHPAEWLDGKDTVGQVGGTRIGRATNDRLDGVELRWGDEGRDYNFGEFLGSTLRGRVQLSDQDGNCFGARENHQPLADVLVTLFDAEGRTVAQTRTNAEGDYAFYNLQPGTYTIFEQTPAGLFDAGAQAGGLAETIVGQVVDPNTIRDITIRSDQQLTNYDFCEFPPATLKGTVYHDANGSGQQDRGENGIAGVVVQLIDEQGQLVAEATTDEEGCYEFTNIRQGTYRVMELHPEGWLDGIDSPGIIGGRSVGRAENPGDKINDIDIRWGDIGTQFDFGEQLAGSISGFVHADLIRDCVYQPEEGEFRLAGVEIQLWDADGQWIASTTTNEDGFYQFAGVPPGIYTVRQIQPQGYFDGGQSAGSAGGDTDVANRISGVTVGSGQAVTDNDFCEVPPVEISGYVFQDGEAVVLAEGEELPTRLADIRPGVRDAGDTPLAGVTLELRNGVTGTPIGAETALPGVYAGGAIVAETDALGFYRFTGLAPGSYAVYQIQPAALVDGVDTPGTSSGVVFNPGEPHNQVVLQSLATNPMNDAIVRIIAPPGTISQENNFSEVAVIRQLIPIKPPVVPEIPLTPATAPAVLPELPAPALTPPLSIYRFTPVGNISVGLRFHTWHLSVIDAGFPRGRGLAVKETPQIWLASGERDHLEGQRLQDRQWQFPAESSDQDERTVWFGINGAEPIQGDFNGDGFDEIGVYCRGYWFIDINGNGEWDREDLWAKLGTERDVPVTGDWDGDGKDDIGVFGRAWPGDHHAIAKEVGLPDNENPPTEQPKNVPPQPEDATSGHRVMQRTAEGEPRADLIDHVFRFGAPGDYPVVGDWNGDGISSIGVFQQGEWHLDIDGDGRWSKRDRSFTFGQAGDRPIVGDFNGDGIDDLAVLRDGVVYLDANGDHAWTDHDQQVRLQPGETPVAGDWDGDGADEIATYSAGKRPNPQVARKAG